MNLPPNTAPVVHRSRKRRFVRWLVVTVVGSFVLVTLYNLVRREATRIEGQRELAAAIAEVESDDPNWTWEGLSAARPKPPVGQNGADLIPRVHALLPKEWTRDVNPEQWAPDPQQGQPNVRYSNHVVKMVRRNVGRVTPAIELARTFKGYPHGHRDLPRTPDVFSTPMPDTAHTRTVALLLCWDAALAAEDENSTLLADVLLAQLNVSRSVADEPMLISQLIRVSTRIVATRSLERAIAQSDIPKAALVRLQTAWASDAEEPLLLYGIRGERAAYDVLLRNLCDGTVTPENIGSGRDAGMSFEGYAWWLWRPNLFTNRAFYLRYMTQAAHAARLPLQEQLAAIDALPAIPEDNKFRIAALILPAVQRIASATLRSTAEMRCAVAGIACERFRQQHKRWPNSLAELVPAYLPAVPLDPSNAEPLQYAKSDTGAVVSSVWLPRRPDDFQRLKIDSPPPEHPRFRLWNPELRRLPPPPDPPEPPPDP